MKMTISGEYYLTGIMETASGFNLYDDHSFEFYFTYGALDRHGYGSWKEGKENSIILNTDYKDQQGFTIHSEEKMKDVDHLVVGIPKFSPPLLKETKIVAFYKDQSEEQVEAGDDVFHFTFPYADKLIVTCLFYFDNPASLIPSADQNNYIQLQPNQNLLLVHFDNQEFKLDGDSLHGRLLFADPDRELNFKKTT